MTRVGAKTHAGAVAPEPRPSPQADPDVNNARRRLPRHLLLGSRRMQFEALKPGQRVRVRQKIDRRERDWQTTVEGVIAQVEVAKTGSWYAHSKDNKFWLRRVRIRKDDGEISALNLDQFTEVELLADVPQA